VDAVGAIRAAGDDFVQEDDLVAFLRHRQVVVADVGRCSAISISSW
jgi:hypothetical protein